MSRMSEDENTAAPVAASEATTVPETGRPKGDKKKGPHAPEAPVAAKPVEQAPEVKYRAQEDFSAGSVFVAKGQTFSSYHNDVKGLMNMGVKLERIA